MSAFCDKSKYIWQDRGGYLSCNTNDCRIFRRKFNIDKKPKTAIIRMFADSAYILYVNGVKIRRVTAFSPDKPVFFDENIAGHLVPGENVIAVMCMHRGYPTVFSDCRTPSFKLELEMVFSGDRKEYIYSDKDFKVRKNTAYSEYGIRLSEEKGCIESADNRSDIYGWQNTDFDDPAWENAEELELGCEVFGEPMLMHLESGEEKIIPAKAVIAAGAGDECEGKPYPLSVAEEIENYKVSLVYGLGSECEIKPLDKGDFSYITVDFGRILTGYIRLEVDSYGGDIIDVVFSEELKSDKPVISGLARFVAKDGENVFETFFDRNTFRYVTLIFRNHIRTNYLRKIITYTAKGFLTAEGEEYELADECIAETLITQQCGAVYQNMCFVKNLLDSCVTPVNPDYSKDILDMVGYSQNGDGFIKPAFPCVYPDADKLGTLLYILAVCEYIAQTNDLVYAKASLNRLISAIDAYISVKDVNLAQDFGAFENILLVGAIKGLCNITEKLGEKIVCEYLKAKAKKITKAINAKYRTKGGIYCDKINEDGTPSELSCDINSAAILYITTKKEAKSLCAAVLDYTNKNALPPSALYSTMFVKAARKAEREDIAEFVLSEFESNKAYFASVCELNKKTGGIK